MRYGDIESGSARSVLLACTVATLAIAWAPPSEAETLAQRDFHNYQPIADAVRIETSEAPAIDGDLSDSIWKRAAVIDEFYQLEPHEGRRPSERTVVRILYDEDNLYFAIMCYDDEPDRITARIKARDGNIDNDDIVRIYVDPDLTRRNGYIFEVNPLGARVDALLQNNAVSLPEWNTLWTAKARRLPDGWSVEVAIPFRSISYDPKRTAWGFDFLRLVRRKNEKIRWSSINKNVDTIDISRAGTLNGISDIRQGLGLDLQAYAALRYTRDWDNAEGSGLSLRPSANAYYKITPSLTGTLTYNTDFSDAPLDKRQVDITRFSLFYPERRDFFLQDAPSFEFGGNNMQNDPNARPFFSRNIGIVNGNAVNILLGGKVSGEYGVLDIGALSVRTAGGAGVPGQLLSVLRLSTNVLEDSKFGVIVTHGDPTGATQNSVAGADFQFHDANIFDGNTLEGDAFYERSSSSAAGQDDAFGFMVDFPNEPWDASFRFKNVGQNFSPALGFASRPGIREYIGHVLRRDRYSDSILRWSEAGVAWDVVTGLDNEIQTRVARAWTAAYTNRGDYFLLETWNDRENTPMFTLPHNIAVPAGQYEWQVFHGRIETALDRSISGIFDVECCGFYGGRLLQTDSEINFQPNETVTLTATHTMQIIDLPTGHVAIHAGSLDFALNFTPDMQVRTQVEYDNISRDLEFSVRYRWEFAPGSELLVVAGDDANFNGRLFASHVSGLSVRLGHTFRL
ncbi:MAG: carbohydrate binding family 9 domain-containing protein [Proteobacteria bacterium]|nr:carbohydrate binding family 9 domain-containing protein [Pseudomonadota bacterium]